MISGQSCIRAVETGVGGARIHENSSDGREYDLDEDDVEDGYMLMDWNGSHAVVFDNRPSGSQIQVFQTAGQPRLVWKYGSNGLIMMLNLSMTDWPVKESRFDGCKA